ncbi:hypothetical protein INR49_003157 [Caranx melampygus]|nr:hypothetical protein INR49_003157 [Caranx melampygus]
MAEMGNELDNAMPLRPSKVGTIGAQLLIILLLVFYIHSVWRLTGHIRSVPDFNGIPAAGGRDTILLVPVTMLKSTVLLLSCASCRHFTKLWIITARLNPPQCRRCQTSDV